MSSCRILVVRLGAMGDIIHTLPAVASLKQAFAGSKLVWALESKWRYLLHDNPSVDEVVEIDRRNVRAILAVRRRLRETKFDIAVDFQGLIKSALVASFGRPEKIYGYDRSSAREKLACLFYSGVVKPSAVHVVDRNLELAAAVGASGSLKLFPLPPGEPQGKLPPTPFVLASPFAGWQAKQWPLAYYEELASRLQRELDIQLVVNAADAVHVPGAWPHASGIRGLVYATRRALAVVGVDSGPMHLAAALGKPGVAIFGPTDPARNGPYGGSITVLRASEAKTTYKRAATVDESMRAIIPEQVMSALKQRIVQAANS
jgi:heptosyltransferase-1